jgi:hypothetical protein
MNKIQTLVAELKNPVPQKIQNRIDKLGKLKVSISDSLRRTWPREPFKDLLENIYKLGKR